MSGPTAGRPPFPVGWFVVARFDGLPDGALVPLAAFGQDLAVGRTASGRALVTHSVCPHLGADLAAGGRIDDYEVVCPLHGWCFSHSGACTSAAEGPIPETTRLRVWPTELVDGIVWAFNGRDGEQPDQPPPALSLPGDLVGTRRPGHPEDALTGMLTSVGVVDGVPADEAPDVWEGSTADGRRATVYGPGTLVVRPGQDTSVDVVVHVTPVDGFEVEVRTSGEALPTESVGGIESFSRWYRRFDRSTTLGRRPARTGRSGRSGR